MSDEFDSLLLAYTADQLDLVEQAEQAWLEDEALDTRLVDAFNADMDETEQTLIQRWREMLLNAAKSLANPFDRLLELARRPLRKKRGPARRSRKPIVTEEKQGPGHGNWGHEGIPGQRGGSKDRLMPYEMKKGAKLSPALSELIESGALDIPAEIKKRKYQMKNNSLTEEYANMVWGEIVLEMKRQGLKDTDIEKVESSISMLLYGALTPESKAIPAAFAALDGASDETVKEIVFTEMGGRYTERGRQLLEMGKILETKDKLSDEFLAAYIEYAHPALWNENNDTLDFNVESFRAFLEEDADESYVTENFNRTLNTIDEQYGAVRVAQNTALDKKYQTGVDIVREVSQRLFERNAESDTLYRGIYDLVDMDKRSERRSYYSYKHGDKPADYWPVLVIDKGLDASPDGHVTLPTDRLTAFSPSKQIARTFAGGGGHKGGVTAKGIITKPASSVKIGLYWPAIYSMLGISIDTKEVWTYNPDGLMDISRDEWELR